MVAESTTQAQIVVPSAAVGTSVTPGVSWANGAWVQLIASTASAITVLGISLGNGSTGVEFEIDIGKGAIGAETVVTTLRAYIGGGTAEQFIPIPIAVSNIATTTRVAVRIRISGAVNTAYTISMTYYATAAPTGVTVTANAGTIAPAAANGVSLTPSNVSWGNSSWVELITSTASAIILAAVIAKFGNSGVECEIDIGTGGAGSETVITTIRGKTSTSGTPWEFIHKNPLDNIATTTRVAVRYRKSGTTTAACLFSILYYAKPL